MAAEVAQLQRIKVGDPTSKPLSQVVKHFAGPTENVDGSFWETVRTTCTDKMGLEFDTWQDDVAGWMLAFDANGDLIHTVGGVALSICRQTGKPADASTPVLTVNRGWVTLADVEVGDRVIHASGEETAVVWGSEIMTDRECYEVTTTDGRHLVCTDDHLWEVHDRRRRKKRLMTTQEILDDGLDRYNGPRSVTTDGKVYQTREYRFQLPRQHRFDLPPQELSMSPYLLGAWLGNGVASGAQVISGEQDADHWIDAFASDEWDVGARRDDHDGSVRWVLNVTHPDGPKRGFRRRLRELGVLNDKHIPEQYLIGSVTQRLALLQGLLDTDGYIDPRQGTVEFTSVTRNLADGVLFLARSLGWRATLKEGVAMLNGVDHGAKYRVCFTPKLVDGLNPFRLERKAAQVQAADRRAGRFTVSIKSIEKVASRPVRCIKVDRPDGLFLAGEGLMVTHNTHTVASTVFGLCVEYPGILVIWTAHHSATSDETFEAMQGFAGRTKIDPFIDKIYTGSGNEEIRFHNGSRIMFGARERGFGRGIPGVDVLINDEAQILSQRAMQNMLATMNTSMLGLHIYMGTPPKPEDNSEMWLGIRKEALAAEKAGVMLEDTMWIEFGADDGADPDDVSQYPKMNPSFPHRTPLKSIRRLRKRLDEDGFKREAMGLYDEEAESNFDMARWEDLANYEAPELFEAALVVDVSPDRKWTTLTVAGPGSGERTLVLVTSLKGTGEVAAEIRRLQKAQTILEVSITAAAKIVKPSLNAEGIDYVELTQSEVATAYGHLHEAIKDGRIEHVDQPELNFALKHAPSRFLNTGEAESFDRRGLHINIGPAVGMACAAYRYGLLADAMPVLL